MNWLDELDAAAEKATPSPLTGMRVDGPERYLLMCSPERIRALIAVVRAADYWIVVGQCPRYDAARAALEATP